MSDDFPTIRPTQIAAIVAMLLASACATTDGHARAEPQGSSATSAQPSAKQPQAPDAAAPATADMSVTRSQPDTPAPQPPGDEPQEPSWGCEIDRSAEEVRRHLGLGEMGPTSTEVRLPDRPGFLSYTSGDQEFVAYICQTWSADSDECDGSSVEVVQLARLSGDQPEVLWRSAPHLGGGNKACDRIRGNVIMGLAIGDWDADSAPDVMFSSTDPKQPRATVRTSAGARLTAKLPLTPPDDVDLCRPRRWLEYTGKPSDELKDVLGDGYVAAAECPDAE